MSEKKVATPLLDELEKGAWPSFVKEIKKEAHRPLVQDLLGVRFWTSSRRERGRASSKRSRKKPTGHWCRTSSESYTAPTRSTSATGSTAAWSG
jgi:hypothetical protein